MKTITFLILLGSLSSCTQTLPPEKQGLFTKEGAQQAQPTNYTPNPKEIQKWEAVTRKGLLYYSADFLEPTNNIPYTGTLIHRVDGTLLLIVAYKDGKKHGAFEQYHNNGQLHIKQFFENGKEHGLYVSYSKSGDIAQKACYQNGQDAHISFCKED